VTTPEASRERAAPLRRAAASAALAVVLSPLIVTPLAFATSDDEIFLLPPVQWLFFAGIGAALFRALRRLESKSGRRLADIAAVSCMVLLPLRSLWVEALLPPNMDPKYCDNIESLSLSLRAPRPLATPYVYLYVLVCVATTVGYFACRSARKRNPSARVPSWGAGLVLVGCVEAAFTTVQMGGGLVGGLFAPVAGGVAWCPFVSTVAFARELLFAAARSRSHRRFGAFAMGALTAACITAALCFGASAVVFHDPGAAWHVFSRTTRWTFSTIPIDFDCPGR
jgi:hypothetical protein